MKARKNRSRLSHRPALSSIAVAATLLAGGAQAAETNVFGTPIPPATVEGYTTVGSAQANINAVNAAISNATGGTIVDGNGAPVTGSTLQTSDNLIRAGATGNTFTNTIDLAATPETAGAGTGAASLGLSANTNGLDENDVPVSGNVTSSVTGSSVSASAGHFEDGNATVTGNTISASTQVNSGSTLLAGKVDGGQTSFNTPGSVTLGTAAAPLSTATGGIVATSVQRSDETADLSGYGSSARVDDNAITLTLTHPGTQTIEAGPVLADNGISATLKGNTARTTIDLQSGATPAFQGSAVLSNLQERNGGASAALAIDSYVGANIYSDDDGIVTLQGALSVSGNSIASAATGNEALGANGAAGNRILVGDQLSVTGASGAGTPQNSAAHNSGTLSSSVSADLAILNSQGNNFGADVLSGTAFSVISGAAQSLDGGSIGLSGNSISAAATGNAAASAIASGTGAAAFDATAAIANQQTNYGVDVSAETLYSVIGSETGWDGGVTHNSTVTLEGNSTSARASGNEVSQSISLAANSLGLGGGNAVLTGGTAPDGNVSAGGGATLSNLQANYNGSVSAVNADSVIGLDADSRAGGTGLGNVIANSTLSIAGNTQEAVALGSSAGNALSLAGNDVSTGAGIASVQIGDAQSPVSATLDSAIAGLIAGTHVAGSTLSVENNLQRAIGYGNSAANTLDVQANNVVGLAAGAGVASQVEYDPADGVAFNGSGDLPTVTAAYGILNSQSLQADVSAQAVGTPGQTGLGLIVEGNLTGSTARNDGNAFVGAAYGNDAVNRIALEATDLSSTGAGTTSVASATNVQAVAGGAEVLARAAGGNVVLTDIEDDVVNASVSTSGNTIQALAYGSRATTQLEAGGVDIETSTSTSSGASFGGGSLQANAAFTVQNAQSGQGSVVATQLDGSPASATSAAGVRLEIGTAASTAGDVQGPLRTELLNSTVAADGNTSSAGATSNSAANGLALDANSLATTSALQNFQVTNADVSAFIGLAGTEGASGGPFGYSVTGTDLSHSAGTFTGGTLSIDTLTGGAGGFALTSAQITYLQSQGWTLSGNTLTRDASGYVATAGEYGDADEGGSFVRGAATFSVPGTPNQGGVTLAVQSSTDAGYTAQVIGSTLSVSDNTTSGSVTGNSASNTLAVTANEIAHGTTQVTSAADSIGSAVVADHALSNVQQVTEGAALTSSVHGTFAIDVAADATIQDSALSVSGNSQRASAVANTASSSLSLAGTSVSAGSALSSVQGSEAAVAASSNLEVFAPAAVANSSVSLADNRNTALGVINDATNTLSVEATNVAPLGTGLANAQLQPGVATGDHVLSNLQTAETAVSSSAVTQLYNQDHAAEQTSGVVNSTVAISGNSTVSEASANRAVNAVSVEGAATLNASAGLVNTQQSSAEVTSTATTSATLSLTGNAVPASAALNGSSLSIDGNSTSALARGNSASNVLNASAGGSYGASSSAAGSALALGSGPSVGATAAVLNAQANSGNVSASSTGAAYQVALNAGAAAGAAVAGGTVGVTGNSVAASAYGNSATNALTLTALNTGAPGAGAPTAAVGNYQVNSGAITATASSVSYGIGVTGGVGGSTLRTTGNQVTANAVGNSAVSSILAAR